MKKPIVLYYCKNRLDAYYIKNIIQKVRSIPVIIKKRKGQITLLVEYNHCNNATLILNNVLPMIPSNLIKNIKKVKASKTRSQPTIQYGTFLEKLHVKILMYTQYTVNQNLHLIS